jgi:molybdopterin-containing oxidoreductase family iron-sulfur binding subunit
MLPACVTTCIGRATIFGNRNDPESLVFQMIGSARVYQLKAELGTQPAVYYLA